MKKFLSFAGVLALAVAFGLAGPANAARPDGVGGGGGGPTQSVSQFSSPFVNCTIGSGPCDPIGEEPNSVGRINNLGDWDVHTTGMIGVSSGIVDAGPYEICIVGLLDGVDTTLILGSAGAILSGGVFVLDAGGNIADENPSPDGSGDWRGLSFQIYKDTENDTICDEGWQPMVQESGITLTDNATWFSEFSSPFVNVSPCDGDCEVTDSTGQIRNDGFWYVLTDDLERRTKYEVCVDAVSAPVLAFPLPFRLADRDSENKGTLFASGNIVERYGLVGNWVGLSLQIYVQDGGNFCEDRDEAPDPQVPGFVQESGITIGVPTP